MARDGAPEGLWLRAETQSGGKGRSGRQWLSPPGNLYATTLVRLQRGDPPAPTLALVSAIALHETASAYARDAALSLKWPNDLLHDGAKLAGILLEREDDAVAAGFGVNLAHHPDLPDRPATSLAALGLDPPGPDVFLVDLAQSFARWLARWRGGGVRPIRDEWLRRCHPVGTALSVRLPEQHLEGLFDGLDETGALRLRLAGGEVRVIQAGDVFLI
jgi:BirA family biotin operon repressor/biotin-[acetyl-CoA-carboxylase] ligase